VDGETLKSLAEMGSSEQLKACGLETVMEQLKMKWLVKPVEGYVRFEPSNLHSLTSSRPGNSKLSMKQLNDLQAKHKMVYLMM